VCGSTGGSMKAGAAGRASSWAAASSKLRALAWRPAAAGAAQLYQEWSALSACRAGVQGRCAEGSEASGLLACQRGPAAKTLQGQQVARAGRQLHSVLCI
jgi:hypothetical protein